MIISGKIILKKGKEVSIRRFHPWIFSGAIHKTEGNIADGAWVQVVDFKDQILGYGHYQQGSISVRMLSFRPEPPSENFWNEKISQALEMRRSLGLPNERTDAFRVIHGEGDGLPGLIVDYYSGVLVVQAHDSGMHTDRHAIANAFKDSFPTELSAIYYKSQTTLPGKLRDTQGDEYLFGAAIAHRIISENNNRFFVDWQQGQKTGFFLDQRENRKLLGEYSRGKKVLNTFCYTGGFSVYALNAGASLVHSVDASQK